MTLNTVTVTPNNAAGFRGMNVWVQAASRVRAQFSASGVTLNEGETITGYSMLFKGQTFLANSSGYVSSGDGMRKGDNVIVFTVHGLDAEGNEISSSLTQTIYAYPYDPPAAEYTATRCDCSGNDDIEGGYIKITPTMNISTCGGFNHGTSVVRYKLRTDALYTDAGSTTDDAPLIFGGGSMISSRSYDILITLTDTYGFSKEYSLMAVSDYWAMKFSDDGHGASFGKNTATSGNLELASGMNLRLGNTSLSEAQLSSLLALLSAGQSAGISLETVWTNRNQTTAFPAQGISFDLSDYIFMLVQFKLNSSLDIRHVGIVMIDGLEHIISGGSKTGTNYDYKRTISCSTESVEFSTGYRNGTAGTGYMIPMQLIGVKVG